MMSETPTALRILHFNDVYHVSSSQNEPVGGAARFCHQIRELQTNSSIPTLTLFSGDVYFPSLESSISRGEHILPVLNKLNIDAACFGNHEFDMGIEVLEGLIKRNNFPWISTNLTDRDTGGPAAVNSLKYLIKDIEGGLRVGIIGIVEKEWLDTLPCLPPTFRYHDFIKSARTVAKMLKDKTDPNMSCDLVICLSHMRLPNDIKLIDECSDVDIELGGHDHFYYLGSGVERFNDPSKDIVPEDDDDVNMLKNWNKERAELDGKPGRNLIKSSTDFRDLSEIFLKLDAKSNTEQTKIQSISVTRHRITAEIEEDPEIKAMVSKIEAHLSKAMDKVIGYTTTSWDARSTVCRTGESNIGNLSADLMRLCYANTLGVQIAFMCGGTIRSDRVYSEGPVKMRDIMELFPFEDPLVVIKMTGEQIKQALENGVSKWPAQEGRFPQVSGIRFEFDPSREPGDRIMSITITASAKAAARAGENERTTSSGDSSDNEGISPSPKRRSSISKPNDSYLHRIAVTNLHKNNTSGDAVSINSNASEAQPTSGESDSGYETDADSEYGDEEDEPLDMSTEYIVVTRDYMYQGHDGYDMMPVCEALLDEEGGISFADLFRRFFYGLAVTNAIKFRMHGSADDCSKYRHSSTSGKDDSDYKSADEALPNTLQTKPKDGAGPASNRWKNLIIKHASNLRALVIEHDAAMTNKDKDPERTIAAGIADTINRYNQGIHTKAQLLTHRTRSVIKALKSSAQRIRSDDEPLRVARTALFGHEDTSTMPLPSLDSSDSSIPRNDDADGLLPGVKINRPDTRTYASEELIARWAVVGPQVDGRITNVSDLKP